MQLKDIRFTLILTLLFIIIAPFIQITNKYYIISLLILLAILHVLAHLRKNRLDKISVLGWSMGTFLASELVSEYPEKIDNPLFMVSVKIGYDRAAIETIKKYLRKNRQGYLYKFYHACFS